MSAQTSTPVAPAADAPIVLEKAVVRSPKAPVILGVFALLALLAAFAFPRTGTTRFGLSTSRDALQFDPIAVATQPAVAVTAVLLALLAIAAAVFVARGRAAKVPLWLVVVFAVLFVFAFLTWAVADGLLPFTGLLVGALGVSTPLIFGALGGVLSERVGVVNVAIEGQLLFGAFSAALVGVATGNAAAALVAAAVAGMLVSFVLAAFSIKYLVDQVIVGVVLNVLVTGLTTFLAGVIDLDKIPAGARFPTVPIPLLSEIPVVGPLLFRHSLLVYFMYIAVFAVWFGLNKTRWGLRLRAVGEHPKAADTVGINVARTRFWNVSLAGAIAGIGGAYLSLDAIGLFSKEMTNGAGFIALAAVIFGRWDPVRAVLAALLFGFATSLQNSLSAAGVTAVPKEFLLMLPYLITVLAVAGLVGQVRGPAAAGKPYIKS
ncbi:hypothetical protein GCM10027515_01720 [Schumannella luteola]|uniref:Simple sugar transport system permease protein n=1 Tax=Schumannella luteola TaxID=472059 RepID=A0A852YHX6_9MICO|nr:ABC transporter permease [Schumannella luteola]NYG98688.1 simple sugar transport system permease protein [Schumannella luteola]TPX04275.1 ABC transporter permease [Schumannella luteola]